MDFDQQEERNVMETRNVWFRKPAALGFGLALALVLAGCGPRSAEGASAGIRPTEGAPTQTTGAPAASTPAPSAGSEPVVIESGGEVPFYARFGENETFDNGEWTAIVFYRPPECIPADFDLNRFFHFPGENDPGAFACAPPTTTSVETWQTGPQTDPAPLISKMTGRGAVPVWFVLNTEMGPVQADGAVTIGELAGLPSRLVGAAETYSELLHPTQSNSKPLIQFSAEGTLADGRAFTLEVSKGAPDVADHVTIDIAD
jgi:hypothetical protein